MVDRGRPWFNMLWCQVRWQKLMFIVAAPRPRLGSTSISLQAPLGAFRLVRSSPRLCDTRNCCLPGFSCVFFAPPSLSFFFRSSLYTSYSTDFFRCDSVQRASLWAAVSIATVQAPTPSVGPPTRFGPRSLVPHPFASPANPRQ